MKYNSITQLVKGAHNDTKRQSKKGSHDIFMGVNEKVHSL